MPASSPSPRRFALRSVPSPSAIFRFDRAEIEKALAAAVGRGVRVSALIAHTNSGGEPRLRKLEQRLLEAGVTVTRTADDLLRYHGKYMVADDVLHVFGFNFTKLDIDKSRSFGIATRDKRSVQEALKLFRGRHDPSDLSAVAFEPRGQSGDGARSLSAFSRAQRRSWRSTTRRSQDTGDGQDASRSAPPRACGSGSSAASRAASEGD